MASSESESTPSSPATSAAAGSPSPQLSKTAATKPSATATSSQSKKRSSLATDPNGAPKATKRRAARACVSCRARKVRCDVVEGAPCGNCRWDNVECIVQESRRRRKNIFGAPAAVGQVRDAEALRAKEPSITPNPINATNYQLRQLSNATVSFDSTEPSADGGPVFVDSTEGHVPHLIYQQTGYGSNDSAALLASKAADNSNRLLWSDSVFNQASLFGDLHTTRFPGPLEDSDLLAQLPPFIKPLPTRIAPEDVGYLHAKGALTLPSVRIQNALVRAYVEYVHPYMPLLELHDFLNAINARDGLCGQVSLFLYHAVLFSATAFVEAKYLREAGFVSRRAARRAFFQRTRLLYDFDYESDRLILVQALLLMTYWYETPDDQKDTWHWMGVAISLAHTIGLHRNPASTGMPLGRQKLWKRVWWSCFMRDRLIALGMRRPTRIKDEDFDVPMLEEGDFEIEVLSDENQILPPECTVVRDVSQQQLLALMCVEKAKLCVCISHMLQAQYSMLNRELVRPENTTNSTMMLFPNKTMDNTEGVTRVDAELMAWHDNLPPCCQYRPLTALDATNGNSATAVQRNLLHMVFQTTISALHRPQFLPSSPLQAPTASRQAQEMSRTRVREAASHITEMAAELHRLRLERYLPTTGVTIILPAMIIHLLEMKSPFPPARERAVAGFAECMRVLQKLREIYAAADFATGFLEAALKKASIDIGGMAGAAGHDQQQRHRGKLLNNRVLAPSLNLAPVSIPAERLSTPPPENAAYFNVTDADQFTRHDRTYANPAVAAGHSPPRTEQEFDPAVVLTPSASGSSDAAMPDLLLDFGSGAGGDASFNWNAIGANLDFDQWLQFPAEGGVNNADDGFVGMFGAAAAHPAAEGGDEQEAMEWDVNSQLITGPEGGSHLSPVVTTRA